MSPEAVTLVGATVAVNLVLWVSYAMLGLRPTDFGGVPGGAQAYFLGAALVAYVANLVFIGMLAAKGTGAEQNVATACVLVYYVLQVGFIPLVRASQSGACSPNLVRALLLACVIPISVLAGLAVRAKRTVLSVLGIVTALHVLVNDAILYGFLFA